MLSLECRVRVSAIHKSQHRATRRGHEASEASDFFSGEYLVTGRAGEIGV